MTPMIQRVCKEFQVSFCGLIYDEVIAQVIWCKAIYVRGLSLLGLNRV